MNGETLATVLSTSMWLTYALAIGLIVFESLVLRLTGKPLNRRSDNASIISGVLAFGGLALANRFLFVGLMHLAWSHHLVDLGLGPIAWLVAFIVYDLMFYVAHRAGHRVRLLWCFHTVHHTSEEMRLTAAIRGSALDFVYLPWFFIWIPLIGLHPSIILIMESFGRLWGVMTHIHPTIVGRLGWLDRIMITPSVHRVHHGRNVRYIDRNYGEVLIFWDVLFGSYQAENEPPDYGVLTPVDAESVVDIQLVAWRHLWRDVRATTGVINKIRTLLGPPEATYGPL